MPPLGAKQSCPLQGLNQSRVLWARIFYSLTGDSVLAEDSVCADNLLARFFVWEILMVSKGIIVYYLVVCGVSGSICSLGLSELHTGLLPAEAGGLYNLFSSARLIVRLFPLLACLSLGILAFSLRVVTETNKTSYKKG